MAKTVGELVTQLQKLPPDSEIWVATYTGIHALEEIECDNGHSLFVWEFAENKFRLVIDDQEAQQPKEFYDNSWSIFREE